jgi:hypothetical protein
VYAYAKWQSNLAGELRGSIAGGTRVVIQGSGFSANTNISPDGFQVYLECPSFRLRCIPIPLHSTVNQIVCKTESALPYLSDRKYFYGRSVAESKYGGWIQPYGLTSELNVVVVANRVVSSCAGRCLFQYHDDWWWHTPRVFSIEPRAATIGTVITVSGR